MNGISLALMCVFVWLFEMDDDTLPNNREWWSPSFEWNCDFSFSFSGENCQFPKENVGSFLAEWHDTYLRDILLEKRSQAPSILYT